jgi:hypothetical protein
MDAMSLLLTTLLSSLVPVGVEGIKQIITNFSGGVKPTTIAEQLQLDEQDIKRMAAVAALDNPGGTPSQWVVDLRGSARYIAAGVVIMGGIGLALVPDLESSIKLVALEAANIAFGFLFGQRIVANFKK